MSVRNKDAVGALLGARVHCACPDCGLVTIADRDRGCFARPGMDGVARERIYCIRCEKGRIFRVSLPVPDLIDNTHYMVKHQGLPTVMQYISAEFGWDWGPGPLEDSEGNRKGPDALGRMIPLAPDEVLYALDLEAHTPDGKSAALSKEARHADEVARKTRIRIAVNVRRYGDEILSSPIGQVSGGKFAVAALQKAAAYIEKGEL